MQLGCAQFCATHDILCCSDWSSKYSLFRSADTVTRCNASFGCILIHPEALGASQLCFFEVCSGNSFAVSGCWSVLKLVSVAASQVDSANRNLLHAAATHASHQQALEAGLRSSPTQPNVSKSSHSALPKLLVEEHGLIPTVDKFTQAPLFFAAKHGNGDLHLVCDHRGCCCRRQFCLVLLFVCFFRATSFWKPSRCELWFQIPTKPLASCGVLVWSYFWIGDSLKTHFPKLLNCQQITIR